MCHSVKVLAMILVLAEIKSESTEEFYVPSTIIFHDIYSNNIATATEEEATSTTVTEDYNINSKKTQFVEFHRVMTTEGTTLPPPKYLLDPVNFKEISPNVIPITTTTEESEDTIKVVPIKKHYQRGLLDLLFPPKRVKTFKNVFDSLRRVLSHTFRR